jgi:hypothetical protein
VITSGIAIRNIDEQHPALPDLADLGVVEIDPNAGDIRILLNNAYHTTRTLLLVGNVVKSRDEGRVDGVATLLVERDNLGCALGDTFGSEVELCRSALDHSVCWDTISSPWRRPGRKVRKNPMTGDQSGRANTGPNRMSSMPRPRG